MHQLRLSVITVCFNAETTIERCITSVLEQDYHNVEYIIIDGGSKDNTLSIINKYANHIAIIISEPDRGIYDAMNKGIRLATGDVVGTLNADDVFTGKDVLSAIADAFKNSSADVIYGNLKYLKPLGAVARKWNSREYKPGMFKNGWMPPHPTFYCKKELFDVHGYYSLEFGTAADYELMLRFIHLNKVNTYYLNKVLVNMYIGGVSNNSFTERIRVLFLDVKAMRQNDIRYPYITLIIKKLSKIKQFF